MRYSRINCSTSLIGRSGVMVIGSMIMPLSERLTLSTSSACMLGERFL